MLNNKPASYYKDIVNESLNFDGQSNSGFIEFSNGLKIMWINAVVTIPALRAHEAVPITFHGEIPLNQMLSGIATFSGNAALHCADPFPDGSGGVSVWVQNNNPFDQGSMIGYIRTIFIGK